MFINKKLSSKSFGVPAVSTTAFQIILQCRFVITQHQTSLQKEDKKYKRRKESWVKNIHNSVKLSQQKKEYSSL